MRSLVRLAQPRRSASSLPVGSRLQHLSIPTCDWSRLSTFGIGSRTRPWVLCRVWPCSLGVGDELVVCVLRARCVLMKVLWSRLGRPIGDNRRVGFQNPAMPPDQRLDPPAPPTGILPRHQYDRHGDNVVDRWSTRAARVGPLSAYEAAVPA